MAKVSLRAYTHEIEAMIDRNHLDEAIAHCQHILKIFPKHLETYRLLGKAYLEAKRHDEAVDIFSRVLVAEPNDFVAQVGMSIIRDEQDKLDDAIWHMERAFEAQPSNAAIQSELQRLYGRRDGVTPPRIRMTRGALAHMYMQGELYPQAISETRSVLQEDQGRGDMQVLLAKAYFKSGQKNDAASAASNVLKRYPYCLDANRVLAEILGSDRPESAQVYRKRVIELDPYAAQVTGSMFQSNEVNDAAVTLDHLDWNGQPMGMPSGWGVTGAISLEGKTRDSQPDWLKNPTPDTTPRPTAPTFASDTGALSTPKPSSPAQPADDIPDFLRAAGWSQSTGAFDESKTSAMFEDQPAASTAQPLAQGDLPDWVKAMAPQETEQPAQEEEIPDWINKIGTSALPVESAIPSSAEQPDWMRDMVQEEKAPSKSVENVSDQPDWLRQFSNEAEPAKPSDEFDFFAQPTAKAEDLGKSEQERDDSFAWLENLAAKQGATEGLLTKPEERLEQEPEWVKQAKAAQAQPVTKAEDLGKSEQERDDSFAWLENLAVKQGATEGLLTKPEERLEQEPEWVKQAKAAPAQPVTKAEDLGKSEQERDDSFAWLEGLATTQDATEGLLTEPGEPLEQKPEWVKEAKTSVVPAQPVAKAEDLGKSEQERDDSFAWLENLAAKQGATEGLLTKPEERLEQEPDWVRQAKQQREQEPAPVFGEELAPVDDVSSWLKGLDEEETQGQPAPVAEDDTASWLKSLDESEETPISFSSEIDDMPAWMSGTGEEKASVTESIVPEEEEKMPSSDLPGWLSGLEEEEEVKTPVVSASEELPSWMRDETGEVVAEPTKIEPTRATDWMPADAKKEEPLEMPSVEKEPAHSFADVKEKLKSAPKPVKKSAPKKEEIKPATPPEPYREPVTRKAAGMLSTPLDPMLGTARTELSRSNIPGALEAYERLIKKGRFLEEVIFDLREALYRYPVEVSIWQTLGDAYMRANQLQDALDSYTKAEELLR